MKNHIDQLIEHKSKEPLSVHRVPSNEYLFSIDEISDFFALAKKEGATHVQFDVYPRGHSMNSFLRTYRKRDNQEALQALISDLKEDLEKMKVLENVSQSGKSQ